MLMIDLSALSDFHFLRPLWFLALLPFALITALQWRVRSPERHWRGVLAPHLVEPLLVHGNQRSLLSPFVVSNLLMLLLTTALAGPSWSRADSPFAQDKAPLLIALDLSSSMASSDLQPSRLQRARDKVLQLVKERGDAYTALYAYAGTGHSVLPLSNDSEVVLHFLDALQVGMLPRRGKSPESVLPLLDTQYSALGSGATLLLIGDGAGDNSAQAFARYVEDKPLQVLVWGMGQTRDQLRDDRRRISDDTPPLQEDRLREIADSSDGYYQQVSVDDRDIAQLQRRIQRHYDAADDSARPWVDRGNWLLPPIILLFLLWFRRGWALRW